MDPNWLQLLLVLLLVLAAFMGGVAVTLTSLAMFRMLQGEPLQAPKAPPLPEGLGLLDPEDGDCTETLPGGDLFRPTHDADSAATEILRVDHLRDLGIVLDTTEER